MTGRVGRQVLGWALVVLGVAALILPGPGLLLLAAGLVVLSQEYEWAARRVEPVRSKGLEVARGSVRTWWTITMSALMALMVITIGVVGAPTTATQLVATPAVGCRAAGALGRV